MPRIFCFISYFLVLVVFSTCKKTPDIDNKTMLDGNEVFDPSLSHPEKYLISYAITNPTQIQKQTPVVIVAHGFSATTYEWDEFRHWADSIGEFYTSQVLLGGHGRDYESFKKATWQDWQRPIFEEYHRLDSMGFTKISLMGSSTGGPLILNLEYSNFFNPNNEPKHIIMIDPIVVSSNKTLSMADIVGPLIGYIKRDLDPKEVGHYYTYWPQESLNQLLDFLNITRKKLEDGITLYPPTTLKIYKSKKDPVADPISALMFYKGIKTSNGGNIEVSMVDSKLHVFTYLQGRSSYSLQDKDIQIKTFQEIREILRK